MYREGGEKTNLLELRKEKGITQKELSNQTGLSEATISFIETGKRNPSIKAAKKLAKVFDLNWKQLLAD